MLLDDPYSIFIHRQFLDPKSRLTSGSQHSYAELTVIHRPFAQFRRFGFLQRSKSFGDLADLKIKVSEQQRVVSKMVCFNYATKLADIINQHRTRFDSREMGFQTVGHADLAASTLLMCINHTQDIKKYAQALQGLQLLLLAFRDLGEVYPVAYEMSQALDRAIQKWDNQSPSTKNSSRPFLQASVKQQALASQNPVADTTEKGANETPPTRMDVVRVPIDADTGLNIMSNLTSAHPPLEHQLSPVDIANNANWSLSPSYQASNYYPPLPEVTSMGEVPAAGFSPRFVDAENDGGRVLWEDMMAFDLESNLFQLNV